MPERETLNLVHWESSSKFDSFLTGKKERRQEALSRRVLRQPELEPGFETYLQRPEDTVLAKLNLYQQGGGASEHQWQDVLGILKSKKGDLDLSYLRKWTARLPVTALSNRALQAAEIVSH